MIYHLVLHNTMNVIEVWNDRIKWANLFCFIFGWTVTIEHPFISLLCHTHTHLHFNLDHLIISSQHSFTLSFYFLPLSSTHTITHCTRLKITTPVLDIPDAVITSPTPCRICMGWLRREWEHKRGRDERMENGNRTTVLHTVKILLWSEWTLV